MEHEKKIIFSATQPSGKITLGNYLGALRNWVTLQEDYNAIYCVADEHAITVRQDPAALRRQSLELYAQFIACGLDPAKSIIFIPVSYTHLPPCLLGLVCQGGTGDLGQADQQGPVLYVLHQQGIPGPWVGRGFGQVGERSLPLGGALEEQLVLTDHGLSLIHI